MIVEAIKQAEDGSGLVLRSFDSHGSHERVHYRLHTAVSDIAECNLLEEEEDKVSIHMPKIAQASTSFKRRAKPYEITSFKLGLNK